MQGRNTSALIPTRGFAVIWGVPALVLAVPLYGLSLLDRRLGGGKRAGQPAPR
jgi:hypothetical protein